MKISGKLIDEKDHFHFPLKCFIHRSKLNRVRGNPYRYLTIRRVALAEWAIDPWPLRAKGLIVLVSLNQSDRKGNNKVSKCNLKKYLFGNKTKESVTLDCANFATRGLLLLLIVL